jgi:hypothetical protein
VLQEFEVVHGVEAEPEVQLARGVVVPQGVEAEPEVEVALEVELQQQLQQVPTGLLRPLQQQQSPILCLPIPRFNTPSPDCSLSSMFSSRGKVPTPSSACSSCSSLSSLGCRPLPPSPDQPAQPRLKPQSSLDPSARRQLLSPAQVTAPTQQLYRLATAISSPSGLRLRLLTAASLRTFRQPAPCQPAPCQPAPRQPAPCQPAPGQPAPRQPAPRQPAPRQPAPRQPASRQPAPRQPAPPQPAPRQPAPRQPAPRQPAPGQSKDMGDPQPGSSRYL